MAIYSIRNEIIVSDSKGYIHLIDISSGQTINSNKIYESRIASICLSPNESYIGILSDDGSCFLLNSSTFETSLKLQGKQDFTLAFKRMIIKEEVIELRSVF